MSARRAIAALTLVAGGITLVAVATADPAPPTRPTRPSAPPRPPVVVVSADGDVDLVEPGGATRSVGRVEVQPGASIRGVTANRGRVFLDIDVRTKGDLSFAGALVAVREGEPPRELARDVAHASTPAVLPDGRVLVSRGRPGRTVDGASRVDELTVDAVDPDTGAIETVARYEGYLLFIAGILDDEVLLYRVGVDGATIAAVSVADPAHLADPGRARVIATVAPFARDFSVDRIDKRLVYVGRVERSWALSLLDLRPGATGEPVTSTSMRGDFMAMIPRALPFADAEGHAELLVTLDPRVGPTLRSGLELELGPGSAHVADADASSGWFTGTVGVEGTLAHVFVANVKSGEVEAWPAPERPTFVAGFARGER